MNLFKISFIWLPWIVRSAFCDVLWFDTCFKFLKPFMVLYRLFMVYVDDMVHLKNSFPYDIDNSQKFRWPKDSTYRMSRQDRTASGKHVQEMNSPSYPTFI